MTYSVINFASEQEESTFWKRMAALCFFINCYETVFKVLIFKSRVILLSQAYDNNVF